MPPFALMNFFKVSSHTFFIDAILDTNYRQESPAMQETSSSYWPTNHMPLKYTGQIPWQVSEPYLHSFGFPHIMSTSLNVAWFLFTMAFCRCNYGSENSPCIRAEPFIPEHRFAVQMFKLRHRWYYSLPDTPSVLFVSYQEVGYEQLWNSAMHRQTNPMS